MKLNIPYYSQRTDVKDIEWQACSCLVLSIKMVSEFLGAENISADDLIKEGVCVGAWDGNYWKHDEVIRLLRNHGISAYAQEFKTVDVNIQNSEMNPGVRSEDLLKKGIEKIVNNLNGGLPTIVSIYKYFTEKDRHHAVVIIGYEKDGDIIKGFYYHDPESKEEKGGDNLSVELDIFKKGWKKLAIFVEK